MFLKHFALPGFSFTFIRLKARIT